MKKENAITLIVLVITIIILIILTGISISALRQVGLLKKIKETKELSRYSDAKETINLKLIEIEANCYANNKEYNIKEVAIEMKLSDNITIEKYYNSETANIKNKLTENIINLTGIVVSANDYNEYKFLIGNEGQIKGVSTKNIIDTMEEKDFKDINTFEKEMFGETNKNNSINSLEELLTKNGISGEYSKEDIANNKDKILEKILENENSIDYIMDISNGYIDLFINSEKAMELLGNNLNATKKIIESNEICKKVSNSVYRNRFSEMMSYNSNDVLGTSYGRTYYKLNDGFALAGGCYINGAIFVLVSKDPNSVLGYCSYDPNFISSQEHEFIEYNGEKWYYEQIPFGWDNGNSISSIDKSKYIGQVASVKEAATKILDEFFVKSKRKSLIPKMESASQNGVTIKESDYYDETSRGWYACAQKDGMPWTTESGNYNPHYLQIEFNTPKLVDSYYLKGASCSGVQPMFYLEGSNNASEWKKLEGETIHSGGTDPYNIKEYNIDVPNKEYYKYYRIYFLQGGWTYGSSGGSLIWNLQLFSK